MIYGNPLSFPIVSLKDGSVDKLFQGKTRGEAARSLSAALGMCSIIVVRIFINDSNSMSHPEWEKQQQGMVSFAGYPLLVEGRLVVSWRCSRVSF